MAIYESDITLFLKELKAKNPKLESEQLKGRALLWDKTPIALDRAKDVDLANLPQAAYPYQTKI
jgi:Protein of unknown function (DUF3460)